jgi:hypothetical protein
MATTLFAYYKGTCISQISSNNIDKLKKNLTKQIETGLRIGVSLQEQINDYKTQLDHIEKIWYESELKYGNDKSSKNLRIDYIVNNYGYNIDTITSLWFMNIASLLKLKVIENDDMNGFVEFREEEEKIIYVNMSANV